jgi:hypothetical protein
VVDFSVFIVFDLSGGWNILAKDKMFFFNDIVGQNKQCREYFSKLRYPLQSADGVLSFR